MNKPKSERVAFAVAWAMLERISNEAIRMLPMNLAVDLDHLLKGQPDTGDVALERTTQNSLEDKAILDLLRDSLRPHLSVDGDPWYSCPKSDDYSGDKPRNVCRCGADEWNERVNAMLASWGQDSQRAG